jgi:hypothetical protein
MASTIKLKNSNTAGNAPSSLEQGEVAINVADGNLFYGDGSSVLQNFALNHITASGNISGSGTTLITAQDLTLDRQLIVPTIANVNSSTHVTSSGNISSSGNVIGNRLFVQDLSLAKSGTDIISFGTNNIFAANITASGNISSSGTLEGNSLDILNTTFNGNTFTTTGDIVLDTNTDIVLDAAGGNIEFKDAGTLQLTLDMDGTAGAQVITPGVAGDDILFKNQGGDSVLTLKSEGQTEVHGNITASGNISASGNVTANNFIGAPIQLVTHAWYSIYSSGGDVDWGLDKLTNGDDNFGWADRVWDNAVDKSDVPDNGAISTSGTFTHQQFNKGFRINHNVTDIELIGVLRPNSSVTELNYYIYKGTPFNGGTSSTITFLASASSATAVTSKPNDIYITGSTGLQADKGDYIFVFANADLGSGNIKGAYTLTAKTRE